MTIYNILDEHRDILALIENNEGEITEEVEMRLVLTRERFNEKAASYGYIIKQFEDNISNIEQEIQRLTLMKKAATERKELMRRMVGDSMKSFGIEEVKVNNIRLSFRRSTAVVIEDETLLTEEFIRVVPERREPDKAAIKNAIDKEDRTVPGATLEERKILQIK